MKTKKSSLWILALTLVLCVLALFSCAKDPDPADGAHTHTLVHRDGKAATCTEEGHIEYWYCSDCGKYYADGEGKREIAPSDTIVPAGHILVHHDGKAASCTEAGWEAYDTCERCDYTTYRPIGKTNHRYENGECVFCHAPKPDEDFEYTLSRDGTYYVLSSIGNVSDSVLYLPDTHNGKPVREIGFFAFKNATFTDVIIPKGYSSIGIGAFNGCFSLVSITIPESLASIGSSAFEGEHNEEPTPIKVCITNLAAWCEISFENDGANPLSRAGSLYLNGNPVTDLVIPDGVTSIGGYAFSGYKNLAGITIPDTVTEIGQSAFYGCENLKTVRITDLAGWCRMTFNGSGDNPLSYGADLYLDGNLVTDLAIPFGVTSIGDYAFCGCTSIRSIAFPDSVSRIGDAAFADCTDLAAVVLPDRVKYLGALAFYGCTDLQSVVLGKGIKTIAQSVFSGCTSLESVTIPKDADSIGQNAFSDCPKLTDITYKGTMAEWENIYKAYNWNENTGAYTIHCTDGDISK